MRISTISLKMFRRFTNLTIDLGDEPRKIIALVGSNGSGKSCIFDALEERSRDFRGGPSDQDYLSKSSYTQSEPAPYRRQEQISITMNSTDQISQTTFYIRSAYRFTQRLNCNEMKKLPEIENDHNRPMTSSHLDTRLVDNYERLIGNFFSDLYGRNQTGEQWAKNNIDSINKILKNILDVSISSLGNPIQGKGSLYFSKGEAKDFPYNNLSSGEKEVIDIILDLYIKTRVFTKTIFCIDEPELHLNSAIQRKLLLEIEKMIPENCQLWIATHSIGFLRTLQEDLKDKSQIINMNMCDFDTDVSLIPMVLCRENWQKIFEIALEDITGLLAPKMIIYCEGKMTNSIDEKMFNKIFSEFHDVLFVSATNKTDALRYSGIALTILNKAFNDVKIRVLIDRDDTAPSIPKNSNVQVCILKRREFENYLFDYEIVNKAYPQVSKENHSNLFQDIINDDVKSKTSDLVALCLEKSNTLLKNALATAIKPGTKIYEDLKKIIFS